MIKFLKASDRHNCRYTISPDHRGLGTTLKKKQNKKKTNRLIESPRSVFLIFIDLFSKFLQQSIGHYLQYPSGGNQCCYPWCSSLVQYYLNNFSVHLLCFLVCKDVLLPWQLLMQVCCWYAKKVFVLVGFYWLVKWSPANPQPKRVRPLIPLMPLAASHSKSTRLLEQSTTSHQLSPFPPWSCREDLEPHAMF